jgi:phosphatidylglycerol:prolipoprotein diacylglycerol transferase
MLIAITIDIDPVAFSLGPIAVRWYGLAYILAIVVALWSIRGYAARRGFSGDRFDGLVVACIAAGFIGGRLYYVVQDDPGGYLREPWRVFEVWRGGMAFFGAIFAVIITLAVVAYIRKWSIAALLDIAALFALVGQPIGRLGNVANGDILGPPTDLPWGVIYAHPDSFAPSSTTAYHPAMFYEIAANLVLLAILLPIRNRLAPGLFVLAYLALYATSQLIVFIWRSEPTVLFGLRQAQLTSIAVLLAVAAVLAIRAVRMRGRPPPGRVPGGT